MMPSLISGFLMGRVFAGIGYRFGLHAGINICNPLLTSLYLIFSFLIGLGASTKADKAARAEMRFTSLYRI